MAPNINLYEEFSPNIIIYFLKQKTRDIAKQHETFFFFNSPSISSKNELSSKNTTQRAAESIHRQKQPGIHISSFPALQLIREHSKVQNTRKIKD